MNNNPPQIDEQDRFFFETLQGIEYITTGRYEAGDKIYRVGKNGDVVVCTEEAVLYIGTLK